MTTRRQLCLAFLASASRGYSPAQIRRVTDTRQNISCNPLTPQPALCPDALCSCCMRVTHQRPSSLSCTQSYLRCHHQARSDFVHSFSQTTLRQRKRTTSPRPDSQIAPSRVQFRSWLLTRIACTRADCPCCPPSLLPAHLPLYT